MKKQTVRLLCLFWSIAILLGCFAVPTSADSGSVYADLNYTPVTEDLEQLGFDLNEYPIDQTIEAGQTEKFLVMMQVLEFGYDYRQTDFSDYGLFLYLYNPSGTDLTGSMKNKVQLALKTANGVMGEYSKYDLLRCSGSSDHRFYKYRVVGLTATLLRTLNRDRRTYCISGIEMQFSGDTNPTDFKIGGTYTFSGHQQGYGFNPAMEDSLYYTYRTLETIELELHPTTWRSEYQSDKGANWRDEVDSVYFAIPNWYFKQYGDTSDKATKGLYSARVSYNEHYVNGIVSDNLEMIQYLQERNDALRVAFSHDDAFSAYSSGDLEKVRVSPEPIWGETYHYNYRFGCNFLPNSYHQVVFVGRVYDDSKEMLPRFGMSFYSSTFESISAETFAERFDAVELPDKVTNEVPAGVVGPLPANYFREVSPPDRTLGYHEETLTRDQLLSYSDTSAWNANTNGFSKWFYRLFHKNDESAKATTQNLSVIETVDLTDAAKLALFKNEVSANQHYVSAADIPNLLSYVASEELNPLNWTNGVFGSTVVLLHFAVTDFYSAALTCYKGYNGEATNAELYSGNHYYFEKSYFEDFDVLSLTFMDQGGKTTTLPVTASPVDVGGDLPSPYEGATGKDPSTAAENTSKSGFWDLFNSLRGWVQAVVIILGIVLLAAIVGLLTPLFRPLFNLFGKIFGGIGSLLGGVGRTVKGLFDFGDDRYRARRERKENKQADEDRAFSNDEKKYDSDRKRVTDRQKDEDRDFSNFEKGYGFFRRVKNDNQHDADRDFDNTEKQYDAVRKRKLDRERDEDRGFENTEKAHESGRKQRRWETEKVDLEIRDKKNKKALSDMKKQEKAERKKNRDERKEAREAKRANETLSREQQELNNRKQGTYYDQKKKRNGGDEE